MRMRCLVTGGAGFIGATLCRRLLADGHNVVCLDNLYTGRRKNVDDLEVNSRFSFILHDITELIPFHDALDRIYHLACPASPPHYQRDPVKTLLTSVIGTKHVLDLAKHTDARVLFSSTSEVYGDPTEHPQEESYRGNVNCHGPRACYDEGKRAAEALCMDYHRHHGIDIRVVRIFNTYGPYMDPDDGRVVSNFIMQALRNEPLTIYGDGAQTRSFQYVDDLVEGVVRMMENETKIIGPVNLGNPDEFTVRELADLVLQFIPESTSRIEYRPLPTDDPRRRKPDITLAQHELQWTPSVALREGIRRSIPYFTSLLPSLTTRSTTDPNAVAVTSKVKPLA